MTHHLTRINLLSHHQLQLWGSHAMAVSPEITYLIAALSCATVGSVCDLRSRRVPNLLTGPAIIAGLGLHLLLGGPAAMGLSLLSGLIAGGLFLVFFLAGGMGAGDVKLMMAIGCLAGTVYLKEILIATVVVGGLMGVVVALFRGRLRETIANVFILLRHHGDNGMEAHGELNVRNPSTLRLPYAVPIAAGCLLTSLFAFVERSAN